MSEWNFFDPSSREKLVSAWRREAGEMLALAEDPDLWGAQTACDRWQVRDVIGHMVDTTEAYFTSFDAARGNGEAPGPLGVRDMSRLAGEAALPFRDTPQDALLARLRKDLDRMLEIIEGVSDDEWSGLMVPHKYMGPLPACIYPEFQLVDYTVHTWDIREGTDRAHAMDGDSADLLVPLAFILWQSTAELPENLEPFAVGVEVASGRNAGGTRIDVTPEGLQVESGDVDGLPAVLEFDPAGLVLTAFGRINGGTRRGDQVLADRFLNLFFRI